MDAFAYILVFSCLVYSAGVMVVFRALGRLKDKRNPAALHSDKPFVSVVVAARNERATIGACLASIMNQDYPAGRYEIIVADDRSEDGTRQVLERFARAGGTVKAVRIENVPDGVSPKKHALSAAIDLASGEIVLQTDADCVVPETWITGMVGGFGEDVGMVLGFSPYAETGGVLNSFVRHEYLWNAALAAGSVALGYGTHATGRNLAFRRKAFAEAGGYGESREILSGDDTLFLHRLQEKTNYRIAVATDAGTHVMTRAPESFGAFLRQRIRHMSTGRFFHPGLVSLGVVVYGFHALLGTSLFLSFLSARMLGLFCSVAGWKAVLDALAAWRVRDVLGLEVQWGRFVVNELLLMGYMAVVPLLGLFVPVRWKEERKEIG